MKNLKLSLKIGFGFASLIIIALCLGSVAVWKMTGVKADTTTLATDFMPAVVVANDVEREALSTMYAMRGYAYTEDEKFLKTGRQRLADVKKSLLAAKELAGKSGTGSLVFLKQAAEKAEAKALEYEQMADQTVAITEALHKDRAAMDEAAQKYMNVCATYLNSQEKLLKEDLGVGNNADAASAGKTANLNAANILDRTRKMVVANDIVDLGNAIRIGNFKSQALRDPKLFQETQKKFEDVNKKLDELKAATKRDADLRLIEECRAGGNAYNTAMTSFLKNWQAREDLGQKRGLVADAVLAEAKNTAINSTDMSSKMTTAAAGALGTASTTMIVGLTIAVIVGVLMAVFITHSITRPIKAVATTLSAGADQTASAAGQVSSASQSLAEGASEQAASLEETSSSLEEMSSMIKKNAENAQKAQTFANQARVAGDAGTADMKEMSAAIGAIKASSDDIAMIIETIHEIAFQTNILALNAAVEAARAGEAGMGFAVVADEVRNLAQRCAQAAKEITGKIKDAVTKSQNGVNISAKVAKGLDEIVAQARQVDELISDVATASKEQAQGITQVNTAVSQMDKVTQSNAASAEESASAAEELNAQAEALQEAVSQLMQLVDGNSAVSARHVSSTAPKAPSKTKAKAATVKASKNGDNGHGHDGEDTPAHREQELVATGGNRGGDIPMDGDFKRF